MSSTPMAMSLDYLRKQGYFCWVTEHSPRIPGRGDLKIKRDLFGFADLICLREHVLLVQTTSTANISARIKKIQSSEAFEWAKRAGMLIHVHGWGAGGVRVIDMTNEKIDWSAVLRRKHKGHMATQEDLAL